MIAPCRQYLCEEAGPRWKAVVFGPEVFIALLLAIFSAFSVEKWDMSKIVVREVAGAILTYASIALGFCLAGMTLALTLPNQNFASLLASKKPESRKPSGHSMYSDLLFVFSWTSISHWIVILHCLFLLFIWGDFKISVSPVPFSYRIFVGYFTWLLYYCLFQFLITLVTLSQVGAEYFRHLAAKK